MVLIWKKYQVLTKIVQLLGKLAELALIVIPAYLCQEVFLVK